LLYLANTYFSVSIFFLKKSIAKNKNNIYIEYIMALTGGKRKVNKSLKAWVTFVKKVQKEENLSYKDAIHRAKVRKDKGEKWMTGGGEMDMEEEVVGGRRRRRAMKGGEDMATSDDEGMQGNLNTDGSETGMGGGRRRRTMRKGRSRGRRRSQSRRRSSRRR
jgi:hypothetical protein